MDPLSIIASVTGILAVAAKITTSLTSFIGNGRNAPDSMKHIVAELSELSLCLTRLMPFIEGQRSVPNGQADVVTVEQVVVIGTSLITNISELDKWLDAFDFGTSLSMSERLRWVRKEKKIREILGRVRVSKESLNLILTIFSW